MASSTLFLLLSFLRLTLAVPFDYTQSTGRLIGNNFGVPGQNLTYDYIVSALFLLLPIPWVE